MRTLLSLALFLVIAGGAVAQAPSDVARLELLHGWRQADGTHVAGLRINLAPGWKTYWRAPGEAGIPPAFDWSGSSNLAGARTSFPVPEVFDLDGLQTIGYSDNVVFPIALRPQNAGEPIALQGRVALGVCETVCIPFEARITATLSPEEASGQAAIQAALSDTPMTAAQAGVRKASCHLDPIRDGLRITAVFSLPPLGRDEVATIELADPSIWVSQVETRRKGETLTATADLVPTNGEPFALDRSSLRFTVLSDGRAAEVHGCDAG